MKKLITTAAAIGLVAVSGAQAKLPVEDSGGGGAAIAVTDLQSQIDAALAREPARAGGWIAQPAKAKAMATHTPKRR